MPSFSLRHGEPCFLKMATLYLPSHWLFHSGILPHPTERCSLLATAGPCAGLMTGLCQLNELGKVPPDSQVGFKKKKKSNEILPGFCVSFTLIGATCRIRCPKPLRTAESSLDWLPVQHVSVLNPQESPWVAENHEWPHCMLQKAREISQPSPPCISAFPRESQ